MMFTPGFTCAKIWYFRMQWPTSELVFPLFPTLLLLIKKRAAPDTHWLAISVIYGTDSISSKGRSGREVETVVPIPSASVYNYMADAYSLHKISSHRFQPIVTFFNFFLVVKYTKPQFYLPVFHVEC
jgi:hypothetical protein